MKCNKPKKKRRKKKAESACESEMREGGGERGREGGCRKQIRDTYLLIMKLILFTFFRSKGFASGLGLPLYVG